MNNTFEFNRFIRILWGDILENRKLIITSIFSLFGLLIVLGISFSIKDKMAVYYETYYTTFFYLAGLAFTSLSFHELYSEEKSLNYLLRPSSLIEKYLSKFIISSIFFILVISVLFLISSYTSNLISPIFTDNEIVKFDLFNVLNSKTLGYFIIAHSFFFFFSIFFKKIVFIKTVLTLHTILFLFSGFIYLTFRIIFYEAYDGLSFSLDKTVMPSYSSIHKLVPGLEVYLKTLTYFSLYFIPPIFWFLSLKRLQEEEVKGGV